MPMSGVDGTYVRTAIEYRQVRPPKVKRTIFLIVREDMFLAKSRRQLTHKKAIVYSEDKLCNQRRKSALGAETWVTKMSSAHTIVALKRFIIYIYDRCLGTVRDVRYRCT